MIRWDLGVPMGLRTKVIARVSLGVAFCSTEPAFVSDKVYERESPGLTLVRSTKSVPRSEGADATSVAGAAWETEGSNLDVALISNACAKPSLISTGTRARNTNRAFWPIPSRGVAVTDGSSALIWPVPSTSWKNAGWKDGGSVEVSWNASSAFPRFVMTNGTTIESPDVATYWARTSATSTLATRSTTRKTVSPAGGAASGGRVGATGGGLRPGFPGAGLAPARRSASRCRTFAASGESDASTMMRAYGS